MKLVIGWRHEPSRQGPSAVRPAQAVLSGSAEGRSQPRSQFGASPRSATPTKPVPRTRSAARPSRTTTELSASSQRPRVDLDPRRTPQDQVRDGQVPARSARPPQGRTRPDADTRSLVSRLRLRPPRPGRGQDDQGPWRRPGIVNLATDSGRQHTGEKVEKVGRRMSRRRAGSQRRGSKATRRQRAAW